MKYTERYEAAVAETVIDLIRWRKLIEKGVEGKPARAKYCQAASDGDT